uniref:Uncharacterized protein n=1 Tax=Laticauda laticaudata TaxID=8630 RepID=A0A8C5RFN7_LATLA
MLSHYTRNTKLRNCCEPGMRRSFGEKKNVALHLPKALMHLTVLIIFCILLICAISVLQSKKPSYKYFHGKWRKSRSEC